MNHMEFKNDCQFSIWGFSISHNTLLLRSLKVTDDSDLLKGINDFTTDVEFHFVSFIGIPTDLSGIEISIELSPPNQLLHLVSTKTRVYRIISSKKEYYILAEGCTIGKSSMDYSKNRLENPFLEYDEILMLM